MNTKFFDKLKKVAKRAEETFTCDGESFTVRGMSGNMRDYYDADTQKRVKFKGRQPDMNTLNTVGTRALVVAMTLVDADTGELAFDYENKEDLLAIGELDSNFLDKVFEIGTKLSGLSVVSEKDAEKN